MDFEQAQKNLANLIKEARKERGMTQVQLERLLGRENCSVSSIERSIYLQSVLPKHEVLNAIAYKIFGIQYWELIRALESGEPTRQLKDVSHAEMIVKIGDMTSSEELWELHDRIINRLRHL